jgi:hypothetical protein
MPRIGRVVYEWICVLQVLGFTNACFESTSTWKSHWRELDWQPTMTRICGPLDLKFRFIPTSSHIWYPSGVHWQVHIGYISEVIPDVPPMNPSSMLRSLIMRSLEIGPAVYQYRAAGKLFVNSSRKRARCGLRMLGHPVHRTKICGFKNQRHAGCLRNRASWSWVMSHEILCSQGHAQDAKGPTDYFNYCISWIHDQQLLSIQCQSETCTYIIYKT